MLHKRLLWLVPLIGFVSVSCTPAPIGRFINNTDQAVTLEISWWAPRGAEDLYRQQLVLTPRTTRKCNLPTRLEYDIQGKDANGKSLFACHIAMTSPDVFKRYVPVGGGMFSSLEIHFLVTENGVYPIPMEYRKDWQDHLDAITSANPP